MFSKRPWIWFILAWMVFLALLVLTLVIAQKNNPDTVPVEKITN